MCCLLSVLWLKAGMLCSLSPVLPLHDPQHDAHCTWPTPFTCLQLDVEAEPFSCVCSPVVGLGFIDHVVGNQPDDQMMSVAKWLVHYMSHYHGHTLAYSVLVLKEMAWFLPSMFPSGMSSSCSSIASGPLTISRCG